MIAEFAENVSVAHEQFANQIRNIVDSFAKKNNELKKEIPVEYPPCSLYTVWEELLRETQQDAEAHAETATLIAKNVCVPLVEISSHKKNESKQLCSYRDKFESLLQTGENNVEKCYKKYTEAYTTYENDETVSQLPLGTYNSAHNDYLLQLEAANAQEDIYHESVLPQMLQELEDIHTDLSTTLNNAFTSHCLLFSNKAKEQNRRFEDILNLCKNVNSKTDINVFLSSLHPEVLPYTAKHFTFSPPAQVDHTVSQWTLLDQRIIFQRHTEIALKSKELFLQKEAAALTSLLRNNEQTTLTLIRICQRNLANHLYAKVYETQEDLCLKRNGIRMANLQLASVRAQIELLSPQQNGTAVDLEGSTSGGSAQRASIKGMWKKAFRSLKSHSKDKDDKSAENKTEDRKHVQRTTSLKLGLMKRKDSKEQAPHDSPKVSAQKKGLLKRKDSKDPPSDEMADNEISCELDPVYSLLKCAADLPRYGRPGNTCCIRTQLVDNITLRTSSRTSSSSSVSSKLGAARTRRVRFQQEPRIKSQSLETPYHHSHEQQKLNVEMESDIQERASSYTAIFQSDHEKQAASHHYQMSAFVSHAQRSFSADDLSPSTSDHEKWEREALTDYLLSVRGRSLVDKTRSNRGGAGRCQDNDRQNNRRRAYEKQRSRSFDLMLGGGYNPCLWSPVEEHKQLSTSKYESISSEEGHPTDYINLLRDNKDAIDGSYIRPPSRKMMPNVRAFVPNNVGKTGNETVVERQVEVEQKGRRYLPVNQGADMGTAQEQRTGRNASGDRDRSSHDKRSENAPLNFGVEKQVNCGTEVRVPARKVSPNINRGAVPNEHRSRRKSSAAKPPDIDPERRSSVLQNGEKRAPLLRQPASQCDSMPQNVKSGRRESSAGRWECSAGRRESSSGRHDGSAGKHDGSMGRQLPQIPQDNGEVKQRRLIAFHEKKSHSLDSSFEDYMDENAELTYSSHHHSLSVQQRRARMMHENSYSLDMPYVPHEVEFTRDGPNDVEAAEQWRDSPRHVSYGDARTIEHSVPLHNDVNPGSEYLRTIPRRVPSSQFGRSATFISSGPELRSARNVHSSHGSGDRDRSSHDKRSEHSRSSQQYPGAEFYSTHHQVESDKADEKHKKNREKPMTGEVATPMSSHSRHVSKILPQQVINTKKKVPSMLDLQKTRVDMQCKQDKLCEKPDGAQEKSSLRKTAQEKRFHQFRQQKSYSYEMPYELERYPDTIPAEGHAPLTAQGRRRRHFRQQKSHSCEVPQAAPPSAAHNEAVWMAPERRYRRMTSEAEGYATPSPVRSPRSPRDMGNVPLSDVPVRSPRSPRDIGHVPAGDVLARSLRSPREASHVPLSDVPVRSPRSPRDAGDVPKNGEGKRIKNLAEREADFWKKKRLEFFQQQRSCSFAAPSSDIEKNKDSYENSETMTDTIAKITKEQGCYTGDEQLMSQLQEAINVEARQQHNRSTRMQRFRAQKSHSLNVDSCTKPLPIDRGPLEVGERNRSVSSHAARHDSKSITGSNNHKLMSLHSMKSIKTDDHVNTEKTDSTSKHKATLTKQSSRASSGSRDTSRTHSPHLSSSIPRPVVHGVPEEPSRTSSRRQDTPSTDATMSGNGNSRKTSGMKLGMGLRKGCCIAPSGGSSDYSESFEHRQHCTTSSPPDMIPVICYKNCTGDVVEHPRGCQMVLTCPDENIAGLLIPSSQRSHYKKLNLRMKSFSVDSDNPPTAPAAPIDKTTKSKSHSSSSFTNLLGGGGQYVGSTSPTMQHHGSRGRLPGFINPDIMYGDESQRFLDNQQRSPTHSNSPKVARNTSTHNLYVALYGFKGREKDDLDLKARWRVTVTDMSDTAWWKGRCNGKTGYFPASYVTKLHQGEKVLQVVSGLETSSSRNSIKLRKDQIVIQEGPEDKGMIPIRTSDLDHLPCPVQYLAEVDS